MKTVLWLDDFRNPFDDKWSGKYNIKGEDIIWVGNFDEFTYWINLNGLPDLICFDHDLGCDIPTGYDCARWLVDYCLDRNQSLCDFISQSDNPPGRENILKLLTNFIKR